MNRARIIAVMALLVLFVSIGFGQEIPKLGIAELPSLPVQEEGKPSLGFAGMMGGAHNDVIIAAGGANFPNGLPWEGGKKVYSDKIYVLNGNQWQLSEQVLPSPLAYGASVSTPEGVLVLGGEDKQTTHDKVFLLRFTASTGQIEIIDYPFLPEPLAYSAAQEFGMPVMDLSAFMSELIPEKIAEDKLIRKHHALPLFKRGNRLFVATSDPTNIQALDELKFHTGLSTDAILVEDDKLGGAIEKYLESQDTSMGDLEDADLDGLDVDNTDDEKEDNNNDARFWIRRAVAAGHIKAAQLQANL